MCVGEIPSLLYAWNKIPDIDRSALMWMCVAMFQKQRGNPLVSERRGYQSHSLVVLCPFWQVSFGVFLLSFEYTQEKTQLPNRSLFQTLHLFLCLFFSAFQRKRRLSATLFLTHWDCFPRRKAITSFFLSLIVFLFRRKTRISLSWEDSCLLHWKNNDLTSQKRYVRRSAQRINNPGKRKGTKPGSLETGNRKLDPEICILHCPLHPSNNRNASSGLSASVDWIRGKTRCPKSD